MNTSQSPVFEGKKASPDQEQDLPKESPSLGEVQKPEAGDSLLVKEQELPGPQPEEVVEIDKNIQVPAEKIVEQSSVVDNTGRVIDTTEITGPVNTAEQAAKLTEDINDQSNI